MHQSWVYIMTNKRHNVLYVGVTSDLEGRVLEHKKGVHPTAFTLRYQCHELVWFQEFDDIEEAIAQEKRIKRWRRAWKDELIIKLNPEWKDLSDGWYNPRDLTP
ncbi:MAG: GIY-YIG nuclease family protein [Flavobacteriales bacterium]|nr:GIY-YIG nuclease family protein [Flavobacteriales bacterium]MBP6696547.1 GIY-YIG nuclease family protein [Flavobacteriales bacterium]